jgi:hypothetical protein
MAGLQKRKIPLATGHSAAVQVEFLARAAELLRWGCPQEAQAIEFLVKEIAARLRDTELVTVQWDPKPDHVFMEGEQVTFIDLDAISLGDPARDPAHLAAHITCRIDLERLPEEAARSYAATLVEEYFGQVPGTWRTQFDLQYAIACLEAACGLFKRQEPGWRERAPAAIKEAARGLDGCGSLVP